MSKEEKGRIKERSKIEIKEKLKCWKYKDTFCLDLKIGKDIKRGRKM